MAIGGQFFRSPIPASVHLEAAQATPGADPRRNELPSRPLKLAPGIEL
jgi:hypothetical protein